MRSARVHVLFVGLPDRNIACSRAAGGIKTPKVSKRQVEEKEEEEEEIDR